MVTAVKHEWHQVDRQYTLEITDSVLEEIYPDLGPGEIAQMLENLEEGLLDVEDIVNDAYENNVDLDWDHQYDDCWTDRKGGYDVTYELGDEDSYHSEPEEPPPTHKCTKCRWEGKKYETRTALIDEQGNILSDEVDEWHDTKEVCPMCDSDFELTEYGQQEEKERAERQARWDAEAEEEEEETYNAECTACEWSGPESDTITIEGQMCCPDCHEVVYTAEQVEAQRVLDLQEALEELKQEFEALSAHTHHCTECDWTGNESDHEKEGICPNCCAYTEKYEDGTS